MTNFRGSGRTLDRGEGRRDDGRELKDMRVLEGERKRLGARREREREGEGPVGKRRRVLDGCGDGGDGDGNGTKRITAPLRIAVAKGAVGERERESGDGDGDGLESGSGCVADSVSLKREGWLRSLERRVSPPLRRGMGTGACMGAERGREGVGNKAKGGEEIRGSGSRNVGEQKGRVAKPVDNVVVDVDVELESETEVEVDSETDSGSNSDVQITGVARKGHDAANGGDASRILSGPNHDGFKSGHDARKDRRGSGSTSKTKSKSKSKKSSGNPPSTSAPATKIIPSPIQLTRIRDLPPQCNVDTVSLKDILGDPLIRECWQFNFCFDLDFIMYVGTLFISQPGAATQLLLQAS